MAEVTSNVNIEEIVKSIHNEIVANARPEEIPPFEIIDTNEALRSIDPALSFNQSYFGDISDDAREFEDLNRNREEGYVGNAVVVVAKVLLSKVVNRVLRSLIDDQTHYNINIGIMARQLHQRTDDQQLQIEALRAELAQLELKLEELEKEGSA